MCKFSRLERGEHCDEVAFVSQRQRWSKASNHSLYLILLYYIILDTVFYFITRYISYHIILFYIILYFILYYIIFYLILYITYVINRPLNWAILKRPSFFFFASQVGLHSLKRTPMLHTPLYEHQRCVDGSRFRPPGSYGPTTGGCLPTDGEWPNFVDRAPTAVL